MCRSECSEGSRFRRLRSGAKLVASFAVFGAVAVAACVDLSAPKGQPASISQVQLPALFVVQGDTMRDTLGRTGPPSILAFDGAGNVVTSYTPTFFITDSLQQLHFSAVDGSLVSSGAADTAGAVAHVVGQIGSLQTGSQTVYVTVRPDTLARVVAATASDTFFIVAGADSARSVNTLALSTAVRGVGGRAVPGVFVRYELATPLESNTSSPAVYLRDDGNNVFLENQSTPDTADASGATSRTLVINRRFIADDALRGTEPFTIEVVATAMYNGIPLQGSPLRILIPVKGTSLLP